MLHYIDCYIRLIVQLPQSGQERVRALLQWSETRAPVMFN